MHGSVLAEAAAGGLIDGDSVKLGASGLTATIVDDSVVMDCGGRLTRVALDELSEAQRHAITVAKLIRRNREREIEIRREWRNR